MLRLFAQLKILRLVKCLAPQNCIWKGLSLREAVCVNKDKLGWKLYLTNRRLRSGICLVTSSVAGLWGWSGCIITARERVWGCYEANNIQSKGARGSSLKISWNWCFSLRGKQSWWLTTNVLFRLSDPGTHFLSLICQYCLNLSLRVFNILVPNMCGHSFVTHLCRALLTGDLSFHISLWIVYWVLVSFSGSINYVGLAFS